MVFGLDMSYSSPGSRSRAGRQVERRGILRLGIACEHRPPAVDGHGRAVDEARIIREQVNDCGCDLLGMRDPAERMQLAHLLFDPRDGLALLPVEVLAVPPGGNRARCNGVDANSARPVLASPCARQSLNGRV